MGGPAVKGHGLKNGALATRGPSCPRPFPVPSGMPPLPKPIIRMESSGVRPHFGRCIGFGRKNAPGHPTGDCGGALRHGGVTVEFTGERSGSGRPAALELGKPSGSCDCRASQAPRSPPLCSLPPRWRRLRLQLRRWLRLLLESFSFLRPRLLSLWRSISEAVRGALAVQKPFLQPKWLRTVCMQRRCHDTQWLRKLYISLLPSLSSLLTTL